MKTNFNLKKYNTFGIDCFCDNFLEIKKEQDLFDFLKTKPKKVLFLGNGSNILFTKDFSGTVIYSNIKKIQEIKKTLPIVLMDNISSDKSIPSVTIDNFNSSSKCAEYLISLGHKQIAFVSGLLDSDICKERLSGYLNILNKYNIKKDDKLIFKGDYSFESGEKAARYFLSLTQKPTAIMFANDSMAIGAMKVIQENKLNIPKDISIVGFDDIDVASRVFPPLTTIAAPIAKMIEKAVQILIQEINGHSQDYQHIILPADLVIRNSCASPKK